MASVAFHQEKVEALRRSIRGAVLQPNDEGYEGARRIWNGMIDKRPAAIARCTGPALRTT